MSTLATHRAVKAVKIAVVLRQHGATSDHAESLPPAGWAMAAELAGTKPPSVETQQAVIALLGNWTPPTDRSDDELLRDAGSLG